MKLGFIGCGNMARAIIGGIIKAGIQCSDILVSDKDQNAMNNAQDKYGVQKTFENCSVANSSDILFLAIKPNKSKEVMEEIAGVLKPSTVVVSIMAGISLGAMEAALGSKTKIVRTMPNTPALVGEGMTSLCKNSNVLEHELEQVLTLLKTFSKAEQIPENLMDIASAVSGASPAFAFMFIEAMADAAVLGGMPRDMAYTFVAQTMLGSAKLLLETALHPGVLKDMVCSPGGTTIEGVKVLEKGGFRGVVMDAVKASADKSAQLQ